MFNKNFPDRQNSLAYIAGFHLGFPLTFLHANDSLSWQRAADDIVGAFKKHSDLFEQVVDEYETETRFPLGNPVMLRHKRFLDLFPLTDYLNKEGSLPPPAEFAVDSRLWIHPTGIVLILGSFSTDSDCMSLTDFEDKIVEQHYPELTYMFVQTAKIIYDLVPKSFFNSSLVCIGDVDKNLSAIKIVNELDSSKEFSNGSMSLQEYLKEHADFSELLSDILVDVYYFKYRHTHLDADEAIQIGYVDTEIVSPNPSHLLVISIAFSSFVGFLWVIKHLGEQSRSLQHALVDTSALHDDISHDLKLFRIFCLQFINESSPISIRLTGSYMVQLEKCWREFRMKDLTGQIVDQLETLEQMFDWIDDAKKESRNFKVGLAAILLAIISLSAVTAQLVSTVDYANTVAWQQRLYLISLGFAVGILSTVAIYLLPYRKRWLRILESRKGRTIDK